MGNFFKNPLGTVKSWGKGLANDPKTLIAPFSGVTPNSRNILKGAAVAAGGYMAAPSLFGGSAAGAGAGAGVTTYPVANSWGAVTPLNAAGAGASGAAAAAGGAAAGGMGTFGTLGMLGLAAGANAFGDNTKNITTTTAPWGQQQPYLQDIFQQGRNLYSMNPMGINAATQRGLDALMQPDPTINRGMGVLNDTLSGRYMDPASNPYLNQTFNRAASAVGNNIASRFAGSGRFGSGAMYASMNDGMNNLANDIYGENYQNERTRQTAAMTLVPQFSSLVPGRFLQAGQIQQQAPWEQLANYQGAVSGNFGNTATSPVFRNAGAGVLGGATAGARLAQMTGSDPVLMALAGGAMGGWG